MGWRDVFRPIADQTIRGVKRALRVSPAPPIPSQEEFISPLKIELKDQLSLKSEVGYSEGCAYCLRHRSIDARINKSVLAKEDPEPYLIEIRQELIATRASNEELTGRLDKLKADLGPVAWMRRAVYYGIISGSFALAVSIAKMFFGI